jgi:hypothetical protein
MMAGQKPESCLKRMADRMETVEQLVGAAQMALVLYNVISFVRYPHIIISQELTLFERRRSFPLNYVEPIWVIQPRIDNIFHCPIEVI